MTELSRLALAMVPRKAGQEGHFNCADGSVRVLPTSAHVIPGQIVAIDYGIVRAATKDECRDYWRSQGFLLSTATEPVTR